MSSTISSVEHPVVIRSRFGEVSDRDKFFAKDLMTQVRNDPAWLERVLEKGSCYGGVFCYTPWEQERDIPF